MHEEDYAVEQIKVHHAVESEHHKDLGTADKQTRIALGSELLVRLVERQEQVQAHFDVRLTGIYRPRPTAPETRAASHDGVQSHNFWGLPPGHSLTLVHTIAGGEYRCELAAAIGSSTPEQALQAAEHYWRILRLELGASNESGYRFEPMPDHRQQSPHRWSSRIHRTPVTLDDAPRAPRFVTAAPDRSPFLALGVPLANAAQRRNRLPDLAQLSAAPLQVAIAMESVALADLDRAQAEATLEAIEKGRTLRIAGQGAFPPGSLEASMTDTLAEELRTWLHRGYGTCLACEVCSPDPLPEALLRWIGFELFGDAFFAIDCQDAQQSPGAGMRMGFADRVPAGRFLTRFLPARDSLLASGLDDLPAPAGPTPRLQGMALGRDASGGVRDVVRFAPADRGRHCYIVGATGTGKSTLLFNMIRQDIDAGSGVCLIDPHGDLYREVLEAVPERRLSDLVLLDVTDFERAAGINLLECKGPHLAIERNFVVNEMIRIFDRLYDLRQTGGPMFEQYMRNALLLVVETLGNRASLIDIPRVFEDAPFRKRLIGSCRNPYVTGFWSGQAERAGGEASLQNMAPSSR
jgi:hypothetical protein